MGLLDQVFYFGAPILLIGKEDGSKKLCIDDRGLNILTIKNKYPLLRITDLFNQLGEIKAILRIDLLRASINMGPNEKYSNDCI